jgi:hypothetical protein
MEYNKTVQVSTRKTIQEHIDLGTLSDFIDKMINVGYLFFEKSKIVGFKEYEESIGLTLEEKDCIHFVVNISDSYATDEIMMENFLLKFEYHSIIMHSLEKEFIKKLNDFSNDKMQTNFSNTLKVKVQFLNHVNKMLLSCKEEVSLANSVTTFELERATFHKFLLDIIEDYKSVLVLIVQSYHPDEHITYEGLEKDIEEDLAEPRTLNSILILLDYIGFFQLPQVENLSQNKKGELIAFLTKYAETTCKVSIKEMSTSPSAKGRNNPYMINKAIKDANNFLTKLNS